MATSSNQAPESGIIRTVHDRSNQFAQINRALLQNSALSWEARGVLSYLLSKPEDWEVRFTDLVKQGPGESDRMRRILKELERAGHMIRRRDHGPDGRWRWVTLVFENPADVAFSPYADFPYMEKPHTEKPDTENRHIYIDQIPTNKEVTNKESTPAPAQATGDISLTVQPGTPVNKRPDAPKLRAVPKFAQTPEFAATLTALLETWPRRADGAGPNPKLTERALVLVAPSEYPAVLAGARRVAAGKDAREGVVKNLHTWLADEDWRRYSVGARPTVSAVYANGKRA